MSHNFRVTFATQAYEATKDILSVSKELGHKSVKVTQRYIKTGKSQAIEKWAGNLKFNWGEYGW